MRKFLYIIFLSFLCLQSVALKAESRLGISLGGGVHTLTYEPFLGERSNDYGGKVRISLVPTLVSVLGLMQTSIGQSLRLLVILKMRMSL